MSEYDTLSLFQKVPGTYKDINLKYDNVQYEDLDPKNQNLLKPLKRVKSSYLQSQSQT